ncbi:MAG: hypothetical protein ACK4UP_05625 [Spirosomataceae bacterium]
MVAKQSKIGEVMNTKKTAKRNAKKADAAPKKEAKPRKKKEEAPAPPVVEVVVAAPAKKTAMERFIERTGGTEADYYAWAKECGIRGSNNAKDRQLVAKLGIKAIEDLKTYRVLEFMPEGDVFTLADYILNHCENPADIAACYFELAGYDAQTKESFIAENIRATTKESFVRFSDKNHVSSISPSYLKKDGTPLDIQAMSMSITLGIEVTENDLVEFILAHKWGTYKGKTKDMQAKMKAKVEAISGFAVTEKYMEHLADIIRAEEVTSNASNEMDNDDLPF